MRGGALAKTRIALYPRSILHDRSHMPRWITVAIKTIITLSLLGWLLHRIDVAPVLDRFGRLDGALTAAAIAVMMAQLILTGWRWWLVGRRIGAPLGGSAVLRLTLIGQFFNQTLPSAIGGDAVRAWLAAREGVPLGKAVGGVFADRVVALLILVALVGVTLPLFYARVPDGGLRGGITALVIGTVVGVSIFLALGSRALAPLLRYRLTRPLAQLAGDLLQVLTDGSNTAAIVAIAFIVHLGVVASAWLIARALELAVSPVDCLVLIPPIVLLTTLPVSIAGWGVRESATVIGFGFLGVGASDALALSVLFGLVQIAIGLPGGAVWLARRRSAPAPGEAGDPPS